jgi:hypothetical protein
VLLFAERDSLWGGRTSNFEQRVRIDFVGIEGLSRRHSGVGVALLARMGRTGFDKYSNRRADI